MAAGEREPVGPIEDHEFLTRDEAAVILGVSRTTVGRWLRLGVLRGERTGKGWTYRIDRDEVERVKREGVPYPIMAASADRRAAR